jgi:membrane-bound serine protease (ClpP class)
VGGWLRLAGFGAIALVGAVLAAAAPAQDRGEVPSIELSGEISPATAGWVEQALEDATDDGAELAIIRIDTPGGLDSSTRDIVKDILAAPMPVVVYVYPDGARAASAGAYITQAADVAAMAPGTNIGSATPISIGPGSEDEVLGRKIENDAAAYIRALAEIHDRNAQVAESTVLDAENLTASEALRTGLIDVVAGSQTDLLTRLDGYRVVGPKSGVLDTAGLEVAERDMPLQFELLALLVNPTIAFLLLSVGLVGLAIELFSPGLILPGTLGLVSFILGLYGTAQLPVTVAGIALLVLAVVLFIAEGQLNANGLLGGGGVVALVLSGLLLFNSGEGADVSVPVVIVTGLVLGGFIALAVRKVVQTRGEPVRTGYEELVGATAVARTPIDPEGQVWIEGALWRARLADGEPPVPSGRPVVVEALDGLTLLVRGEPTPAGAEADNN